MEDQSKFLRVSFNVNSNPNKIVFLRASWTNGVALVNRI